MDKNIKATPRPCAECPFKRGSTRGYLGPWDSALQLLTTAFSDVIADGFACHMTVKQDGEWQGAQVCAGSLHCANKSHKIYRDEHLASLQRAVAPCDEDSVMDAAEFLAYHEEPPTE